MSEMNLIVRTADLTKKAEVMMDSHHTGRDIVRAAVQNWAMSPDTDYALVNVSRMPPVTLKPSETLAASGVKPGEMLEIQPVLVAGGGQ